MSETKTNVRREDQRIAILESEIARLRDKVDDKPPPPATPRPLAAHLAIRRSEGRLDVLEPWTNPTPNALRFSIYEGPSMTRSWDGRVTVEMPPNGQVHLPSTWMSALRNVRDGVIVGGLAPWLLREGEQLTTRKVREKRHTKGADGKVLEEDVDVIQHVIIGADEPLLVLDKGVAQGLAPAQPEPEVAWR